MTPVALWTGRLPGLRRLPRKRMLWLAATLALFGFYGIANPAYAHLLFLTIATAGWVTWRHRWPSELPVRLRSLERPEGPDERAVMVEIRQEANLLGWDVGILWFEKGGVGFSGRTVSFVIPRSIMLAAPGPALLQSTFRAPQFTAKIFDTTVGIVPLDPEMRAQMTLARIDALPNSVTSETILPPTEVHPDLLQRGMEVRRRMPLLHLFTFATFVAIVLRNPETPAIIRLPLSLAGTGVLLYILFFGNLLPATIRQRLPAEPPQRKR